jgi:hypothetical protein
VSRAGKKDGLYWPIAEGAAEPTGEFAAQARPRTTRRASGRSPGYYYRILTRQGASAPGGAYDYIVKGKMKDGFALVALPADYNSGIMTFLVNHDGRVFQKDLGPKTAALARKIESFAPDQNWSPVDNSQ